ncbi:MAG: hypothetical protein PHC64_05160 [Candidatus Gastranaerophilales bacterium]|nr:hypothetical protein [Candidatus Gastranaerophilales bacterium]
MLWKYYIILLYGLQVGIREDLVEEMLTDLKVREKLLKYPPGSRERYRIWKERVEEKNYHPQKLINCHSYYAWQASARDYGIIKYTHSATEDPAIVEADKLSEELRHEFYTELYTFSISLSAAGLKDYN